MLKTLITSCAMAVMAFSAYSQPMNPSMRDHSKMDHSAHMKSMPTASTSAEQRQAKVSKLSKDVMPFDLAATTHIFTKNTQGGTQQVVAKKSQDAVQIKLAREHLQEIRTQFLKGDFSGPSHIHGQDMLGLSDLKAAKPGQVSIDYKDVKDGGQLIYKTSNASLVAALHKWFDAQLSDHGKDAMAGHAH